MPFTLQHSVRCIEVRCPGEKGSRIFRQGVKPQTVDKVIKELNTISKGSMAKCVAKHIGLGLELT